MSRNSPLQILFALSLTLTGCASDLLGKKGEAMLGARYGDLEKLALAEVPDLTTSKSAKLFPLCNAYAKQKKYDKAFPCFAQLEINFQKGDTNISDLEQMEKNSPLLMGLAKMGSSVGNTSLENDGTPMLYLMRSEAYMDTGDFAKAIADAKRAAAAKPKQRHKQNWHEINTLGNLALAYALSGDRENALASAKRLEAGKYPVLNTDKQLWLAKTYAALGDFQRALSFIEALDSSSDARARRAADVMLGGAARGESIWEFQTLPAEFLRHKCRLETGRIAEAKAGFDALLAKPKIRDNGDIYWHILYERGRIAEQEGDRRGAIDAYRRAVEVIEQQRSTINTEASKIGFIGNKQAVYRSLIASLLADQQHTLAFDYVERAKARALVDMLAAKQDFAVNSGDPDKVRELLSQASSAETELRIQDAHVERQKSRSIALEAREQLQHESPQLASLISVSSMTAGDIQSQLPADEALVEYYYDAPDLLAFILTQSGLKAIRLDSAQLPEHIRQFRRLLENTGSGDFQALARQLYSQLIAPLAAQIPARKLIVVAHGPLHYLPFAALHDGQGYVIDRYSLRMLPSASVLKYLRSTPVSKPGSVLAFGNPDLGHPKYDLEFAQAEAIAIAKNRPQAKILLRKEANESAFRQYGSEFRYIHFATHGQFNADAPLQSALLLASDATSDGRLSVDKLYSLKLDADLVTLSACETGLGKIANGDDVVGLTRGFLYAGASSIVASLWPVDDLATAFLMTRFYDNLKQSDKREALRQAQLETRKKFAHPYYWAAFQLTGAAR